MKLLVIDIETTGLDVENDAIVEIGAALADTDTKEIEIVFDKVVKDKNWNLSFHKDAWIFKNSDLKPEVIDSAPTLDEVFDELQALITKYDTVAFNLKFDERFLTNRGFVFNKSKCLMEAVKNYVVFKNENGRSVKPSVEEIYNHFLIKEGETTYVESHRAANDAVDEAKIMFHMIELKKDKNHIKQIARKSTKPKEKPTFRKVNKQLILDVDTVVNFGKYKGDKFSEIVEKNKQYLIWCKENINGLSLTEAAEKLLV